MPMSFKVRIGRAPTVFASHSRTSARFLNLSSIIGWIKIVSGWGMGK